MTSDLAYDNIGTVELIDKSSILGTSIVSLVADEARFTKDVRGLTGDRRSNLLARYRIEVLVIWNLSRCRSVIPGNLHLHMVLRKVATGVVSRHRVGWAGKAV